MSRLARKFNWCRVYSRGAFGLRGERYTPHLVSYIPVLDDVSSRCSTLPIPLSFP